MPSEETTPHLFRFAGEHKSYSAGETIFAEARSEFLVQQTPFFAIEVMRVMARRLRRMDAEA